MPISGKLKAWPSVMKFKKRILTVLALLLCVASGLATDPKLILDTLRNVTISGDLHNDDKEQELAESDTLFRC